MGNLTAAVWAEAVETGDIPLDTAIRLHLGSNHFPPVHPAFDAVAKRAIEIGAGLTEEFSEDPARFDQVLDLPNGKVLTVYSVLDQLHLWFFVECLAEGPIVDD